MGNRPVSYLHDRINGKSYGGSPDVPKPPCFVCYAPRCVGWFPRLLEQNCFCRCMGKFGIIEAGSDRDNDENAQGELVFRRRLLRLGIACNLVSMALSLWAFCAISTDFDLLQVASFSSGKVFIPGFESVFEPVYIHIGLRAGAVENEPFLPHVKNQDVFDFEEFCGLADQGLERYLNPDHCNDCHTVSTPYILTVVLSAVTMIPTVFTDILRMYPAYDVNCQKTFGSVFSLISIAMSLATIYGYINKCFDSFYEGTVLFFANATVVPPGYNYTAFAERDGDPMVFPVQFEWGPGNGLICLGVATSLKIVGSVFHLLIPTPTITRRREEQDAYELRYGGSNREQRNSETPGLVIYEPHNRSRMMIGPNSTTILEDDDDSCLELTEYEDSEEDEDSEEISADCEQPSS